MIDKYPKLNDKVLQLYCKVAPEIRTDIESITFLNGIIIITKR